MIEKSEEFELDNLVVIEAVLSKKLILWIGELKDSLDMENGLE